MIALARKLESALLLKEQGHDDMRTAPRSLFLSAAGMEEVNAAPLVANSRLVREDVYSPAGLEQVRWSYFDEATGVLDRLTPLDADHGAWPLLEAGIVAGY